MKYDPIVENQVIYTYEENPTLYKAVRKKVQNRESARRVRSKKVTNNCKLEVRVTGLDAENHGLKIKNATLSAENDLLREQIVFLEKLLLQQGYNSNRTGMNFPQENGNFCQNGQVQSQTQVDSYSNYEYGNFGGSRGSNETQKEENTSVISKIESINDPEVIISRYRADFDTCGNGLRSQLGY